MSNKFPKELLEEDLYELLDITINADEKKIKKSFRKKALICHPDKNPDNPNAADQFNRLKKILEILLDPGARSAYDKVLKGRKAAALRAKQANLESQKFKDALEKKEKAARFKQDVQSKLSEEERFRREIKRLEEEGEKLIEEELNNLNREAEQQIHTGHRDGAKNMEPDSLKENRIKAKWRRTEEWEGYTKEEIQQLFFKWGEINAIVMKTKGSKTTALIEFKDAKGASLAAQFEKGLSGKPIEVSRSSRHNGKDKRPEKTEESGSASRDFESVFEMNRRREAERQRLIRDMMMNDNL